MQFILAIFNVAGFICGLAAILIFDQSMIWLVLCFVGLGFLLPVSLMLMTVQFEAKAPEAAIIGKASASVR